MDAWLCVLNHCIVSVSVVYIPPCYTALLAPVPVIVVILTNKDYEFVPLSYPPTVCGSKNADIVFYSVMLVVTIILAIGMPMLTYLLWTLHKVEETVL